MTEEAKDSSTSGLAALKAQFIVTAAKLRRLETPTDDLRALCEVIKEAAATNRMGTDPEFAEWMHSTVATGLT